MPNELESLPDNPKPTRRTSVANRRTYDLEQAVARHELWFKEIHVDEMSKAEKDALPAVLRQWTFSAEVTAAARRRLTLVIGASSAAAAVLVFVADLLVRYVVPAPRP